MILDELRIANWQRTGKRTKRPKRTSPLARQEGRRRFGRTDRSPAQIANLLRVAGPSTPEEVTADG